MARRKRHFTPRRFTNTAAPPPPLPAPAPPAPPAPQRQGRGPMVEKKDRGYRIDNLVTTDAGTTASVWIYAEIGEWGVSAQDFVGDLQGITAQSIDLHINSQGGDVFEGIAIYNALRAHPATVTAYVDGVAASAASFIAMAASKVKIARNASMMIHDASAFCYGNASELQRMVDLLDKTSDNIADIYSRKCGGSVGQWRKAMKAETWYSSKEAVTAGLADEVDVVEMDRAAAEFELSVFAYAARDAADLPVIVTDSAAAGDAASEPVAELEGGPGIASPLAMSAADVTEPAAGVHSPEPVAVVEPEPDPVVEPVVEPEPEPVVEPAVEPFHFDPAVFTGAVEASLNPHPDFDPDSFRNLMSSVADAAPAPPESARPAPVAAPRAQVAEPEPEPVVGPFPTFEATHFRDLMASIAGAAPAPPEPPLPAPAAAVAKPVVVQPESEPDPNASLVDMLRGAVDIAANNAAAPPVPQAPVPAAAEPGFRFDSSVFHRALEEASL